MAPVRNLHQHAPELFGTLRNLRNPATPTRAATLQNPPEPSETFRNQPFGTPRNLQELASGTTLHRNLPEPASGPHHFTPELSGTFRNPPPEPTPFYTGTLRNLPEPSSGTCSCDPHRRTPELIWAEDPISLRCWEKYTFFCWPTSTATFVLATSVQHPIHANPGDGTRRRYNL